MKKVELLLKLIYLPVENRKNVMGPIFGEENGTE